MFGFSEKASPTAILSAIYQHQAVIEFEPDGKVIKIVNYASDITAETQQKQQFELLSMVANETENAVIISNTQREILYVNRGFEKITGYSAAQMLGHKAIEILVGPKTNQNTRQHIEQKLAAPRSLYIESNHLNSCTIQSDKATNCTL